MRATILLALLVALGGGAQASMIEDTTGLHYQNDGDEGQDATDSCPAVEESDEEATLVQDGPAREGQLVPVDDEADHWRLVVEDAQASPVTVQVDAFTPVPYGGQLFAASPLGLFDLDVTVRTAECDALAKETVPVDGYGAVTFDAGDHSELRLSLRFNGSPVDHAGPATTFPVTEHCAPNCLFGYRMDAT